jgi:hypothetical protein
LPTYLIRLYSGYALKTFTTRVDAPTAEMAKQKIVGKLITDPWGNEWRVEPYDIVSVAPISVMPLPPYKLMPEEEVKEAEWLKHAIVPPEGLAEGSTPVGSPKLETEIPDALTSVFFSQEVKSRSIRFLEDCPKFKIGIKEYGPYRRGDVEHKLPWSKAKELCQIKFRVLKSPPLTPLIDPTGRALKEGEEVVYSEPESLPWAKLQVLKGNLQQITEPVAEWLYPEYKTKIKYRIDIYTKFLEEAKRIRKTDKIKEAVEYLINYSMGIPLDFLAQILGISYWTCWRAVAELARPTEVLIKRIMETLDETATLEKWTKGQEEEIVITLKTPKEPKIGLGYWHDKIICYPLKPLPEATLLQELKRILTLEGYPKLTREEEEELSKQMKEYYERKARERLTYWIK